MTAKWPHGTLVIATHNAGKLREMRELLAPFAMEVASAGELGLPEPEETGSSFAQNAQLKAEAAMQASGKPALADDSGLTVEALAGAPGIYSARWAGEQKDFSAAMGRIEEELRAKGERPTGALAAFECALALAVPGLPTRLFRGQVQGMLTFPPRGDKGFGYDPIFIPEGYADTFGEMEPKEKHRISHRARAFEQFTFWLRDRLKEAS